MSDKTADATDLPSLKDALIERLNITSDQADAVVTALAGDDYGATDLEDVIGLELDEEAWKKIGLPTAKAKRAVTAFARVVPEPADTPAPTSPVVMTNVLQDPPSGESYLQGLVVGGKLKVDIADAVALARIAIADSATDQVGGIVATLEQKITQRSVSLGKPNPPVFYELRKLAARQRYKEILSAMGVAAGHAFTEAEKRELRARLERNFWPAVYDFHGQVKAWQDAWQGAFANPAALVAAMAGGGLAGMGITPPPYDGVIDGGRSLADAFNKVFAGNGLVVARGLAADATSSLEFLENEDLVSAVGAADRDELIQMLDVSVDASAARAEINVAKYLYNALKVVDQPDDALLQYITQLAMLGSTLPWGRLGIGGVSNGVDRPGRPAGGSRRPERDFRD